MERSPKPVHSVVEFFEVDVNQGVENRFTSKIGLQVPFRNVGGMSGSVYQDVIPGLIFRRSASSNLFVPFFGPLKDWVYIEDHSAVVKKAMVNQFADAESRVNRCYRFDPSLFSLLPDNRRASNVTEGRGGAKMVPPDPTPRESSEGSDESLLNPTLSALHIDSSSAIRA